MSKNTEASDLLCFLIEKTENVGTPMNISQLVKEFKKRSGATESDECMRKKIEKMFSTISHLQRIETETKVKLFFGLSIPVDTDFKKELEYEADIIFDDHQRIIEYRKKGGGGLELKGSHLLTRDEVAKRDEKMMEFLAEKSERLDSPMTDYAYLRDFKHMTRASEPIEYLFKRYQFIKKEIYKSTKFDGKTKIRMLFVSSVSLSDDELEELRKDAIVEVDDQNRIIEYNATDGSMKLDRDQSRSAKIKAALSRAKSNRQKLIRNYFNGSDNNDDITDNEYQKEMNNLIKFITTKCDNVDSPLSIRQFSKDFKNSSGTLLSISGVCHKIETYRQEIQLLEHIDARTKVKQLFGLSASLNSDCLKELRKDAQVVVDDQSRITKYTSDDGKLILLGDHSLSAKKTTGWIMRKKNECIVSKSRYLKNEKSDEEDEEESGGESNEESDWNYNSFIRSPRRSDHSDSEKEKEDEPETENTTEERNTVTTRSGRKVLKARVFNTNFIQNRTTDNSLISSEAQRKIIKKSIFRTPTSNKRMNDKTLSSSAKRTSKNVSLAHSPNTYELDDYEANYTFDDSPQDHSRSNQSNVESSIPSRKVKVEPFKGPLIEKELLDAIVDDEDIQVIGLPVNPKQKDEDDIEIIEYPTVKIEEVLAPKNEQIMIEEVKVEDREGVAENNTKSNTSQVKLLQVILSLVISMDTSYLSLLQMEIERKLKEIGKTDRKKNIPNNEAIGALELCIIRITNNSSLNFHSSKKSIKLTDFLCYLKAAILNSKLQGFGSFVEKLRESIEEASSQNKRITAEELENALRAVMYNIEIQ